MDADPESIAAIEAKVQARLSFSTPPRHRNTFSKPHTKPRKRSKTLPKPLTTPSSFPLQTARAVSTSALESKILQRSLFNSSTNHPRPSPPPPIRTSPHPTRHFRSRGISKKRPDDGKDRDRRLVDAVQFVESHRREVNRLGSEGLSKRARQSYQTAERVRLGCRAPKPQKVPIKLLQIRRRKQKVREEKKKEMDFAAGMLVRSKRRK